MEDTQLILLELECCFDVLYKVSFERVVFIQNLLFYGPVQSFVGWSPKYKWQRRFYQQWRFIGHMVVEAASDNLVRSSSSLSRGDWRCCASLDNPLRQQLAALEICHH